MKYLLLILAFGIAACSSHPDPIIDTKGVDMQAYEQDLSECKSYSAQINTGSGMARGAAAGAAVGAAIGVVTGNVGDGAAIGAIGGGAKSGAKGATDKEEVVKRCLRYRGYKVLN